MPVKGNSRCAHLLHTDEKIAHTEQRPRTHRARAPAFILNIAVPVDGAKGNAAIVVGASALDDVDAAAAGRSVFIADDVFLRGGAVGGGSGGAGNGIVGEGDIARYGHDLCHGGRGAYEGEEEIDGQHAEVGTGYWDTAGKRSIRQR